MTTAILGERDHGQVSAPGQGRLQKLTQKGVIDDNDGASASLLANRLSDLADHGKIGNGGGRIGRAFDHHDGKRASRQRQINSGLDGRSIHGIGDPESLNAIIGQVAIHQAVGAAIDRAAIDHAIARPQQGHQRGA